MIPISIIMPVFNSRSFLTKAIESVLIQSFKDFEFIIINDGSTDGSVEIINHFKKQDKRIIFINKSQNTGLPSTLNEGLLIAKGKYIARMDSDDICFPDRLQIQYDFLEKNIHIGIVGTGYCAFNEQGNRKEHYHQNGTYDLAYNFLTNTHFCHPTVMFKKEIIDKIGLYHDEEAEDFDFFSRVLKVYKGANINQILLEYRETQTNRSFSVKEKLNISAFLISKRNYEFFTGSDKKFNLFYKFHKQKKSNIFLLPLNFIISFYLLNQIRRNYKDSIICKEFLEYLPLTVKRFLKHKFRSIKKQIGIGNE